MEINLVFFIWILFSNQTNILKKSVRQTCWLVQFMYSCMFYKLYGLLRIVLNEKCLLKKSVSRLSVILRQLYKQHCGKASREGYGAVDDLCPNEALLTFGKERNRGVSVL